MTETTAKTLNQCFISHTNNSLSFRDSHDSTATLIPSYCSFFHVAPTTSQSEITLEGEKSKEDCGKRQEELSKRSQQAKKNCPFIAFVIKVFAQKQPFLSMKSYLGHNLTAVPENSEGT